MLTRFNVAFRPVSRAPGTPGVYMLGLLSFLLLGAASHFSSGSRSERDAVVRVRLFETYQPAGLLLSVDTGSFLLYSDGDNMPLFSLSAGSESRVMLRNGLVQLQSPANESILLRSADFVPADSTSTFSLSVVKGRRDSKVRSYSGELQLLVSDDAKQLIPINSVDLETYVAAVITSEYGLDDLQGNMAMAVLARTYAIRSKGKFGAAYDHVDHSISQVYHGIGNLKPLAIAGARSTAGEILLYQNELIEAVYHAESGGQTADNESVWTGGNPIPYLRGVTDPYANNSPYAEWRFTANRSRLLAALKREYGGTITGIRPGVAGTAGRINTMVVLRRQGNLEISANDFRLIFLRTFGQYSLKSTVFTVRRSGSNYVFEGHGFGHGVGMSQWGAHEMANRGFDYQQILAFYFTGTRLARLPEWEEPRLAVEADSQVVREPIAEADSDTTVVPRDSIVPPVKQAESKPRRRGRIGW